MNNTYKIEYNIDEEYFYTNDINKFKKEKNKEKITRLKINNIKENFELPDGLNNLRELIIFHSNSIKIIPKYKNLIKLQINDCNNIMEIPDLENLRILKISFCNNLYKLSEKLYNLVYLSILNTSIINIPKTYKKIEKIDIDYNININDLPEEYYKAAISRDYI